MEGKSLEESQAKKVVVFRLGNEEFGLAIDQVLSIEKMQSITKLPNMPDFIRGALNLRGKVIPIVDLRNLLKETESEVTEETRIIVVNIDQAVTGIVVDDATDVLDISLDQIQHVSISGVKTEKLIKIAKIEEKLLIMLDVTNLLKENDITKVLKEVKEAI